MSLTDSTVKISQQEIGISRHVPITHFNSPTILESKTGALFSVIKLSGVPFETEKTEIISNSLSWHRALATLDERFALLGTLHRRKVSCELKGEFNNKFAKQVNQIYQSQFTDKSLYVNDLYLAVIFKGLTTGKIGYLSDLFRRMNRRYVKSSRVACRETSIKQLNDAIFQLTTSLSAFSPHVLGSYDESFGRSELLTYVSLFVNGGETFSFKNNARGFASDKTFEKTQQTASIYPQGHIAQAITAKRIFFGDMIQFQGALPKDTRFAAMISIKRYGAESASIMLDPLLHLDGEFLATQSFLFESKASRDSVVPNVWAQRYIPRIQFVKEKLQKFRELEPDELQSENAEAAADLLLRRLKSVVVDGMYCHLRSMQWIINALSLSPEELQREHTQKKCDYINKIKQIDVEIVKARKGEKEARRDREKMRIEREEIDREIEAGLEKVARLEALLEERTQQAQPVPANVTKSGMTLFSAAPPKTPTEFNDSNPVLTKAH